MKQLLNERHMNFLRVNECAQQNKIMLMTKFFTSLAIKRSTR
jgi:hypothetical protein